MKAFIEVIKEIIDGEVSETNSFKLIKFANFTDPMVYLEICLHYMKYFKEKNIKFISKLSREKYEFWMNKDEFKYGLSELNKLDSIEKTENLTKWRNQAFLNDFDNYVVFLFGTELIEDQGGLEEFFTINNETIEQYIGFKYSKIFIKNGLDISDELAEKLDDIYTNIFKYAKKDLLKLSTFTEEFDLNDTDAEYYKTIFSNINNMWGLPNIHQVLLHIKKLDVLLNDGYKFSRRINFDTFQTDEKIGNIKKGIDDYFIKNKEEIDHYWDIFLPEYTTKEQFAEDLLSYVKGTNITKSREKLLKSDFTIIRKILGYREKKPPVKSQTTKVYGDPFKALFLPILKEINVLEPIDKDNIKAVYIHINKITLANVIEEGDEGLLEKWTNMCYFLGGLDKLLQDNIDIKIYSSGDQSEKFDTFNPQNTSLLSRLNILRKSSDRESKSKIKLKYEIIFKNDKIENSTQYEWSISDKDGWMSFSSMIINDKLISLINNNYSVIPVGFSDNVDSILDLATNEEFVLISKNTDVEFENILLMQKLKEHSIYQYMNSLGISFVNLVNEIIQFGFFSTIKSSDNHTISFLNKFEDINKELIKLIKEKDIKENHINLILKSFLIVNEKSYSDVGVKGAIISPLHPAMLEKMVDRYVFLGEGFTEVFNIVKNSSESHDNIDYLFNRFDQLATITHAADVLISKDNTFMTCNKTYGFYSLYGESTGNYLGNNLAMEFDDVFEEEIVIEQTPISSFFAKTISNYISTYPSKIDGLTISFIEPNEFNNLITAISTIINKFKKIKLKLHVKISIYTSDFKCKVNKYIKHWIENNITENDDIIIETNIKYLDTKCNTIEELRGKYERQIDVSDMVFLQDILTTKSIRPEDVSDFNILEEQNNIKRFPSVYLPIPSNEKRNRAINLTQPQFNCEYMFSQLMVFACINMARDESYRLIKKVTLSQEMEVLFEILHKKSNWVVVLDENIDSELLRLNDNKIIGFSSGEGYYGELNSTISTEVNYLEDLTSFLVRRLRNKFPNYESEELKVISENLINYAEELDGIELLKAINPDSEEVNNFLAYVLTNSIENGSNIHSNFIIRKIVSLDTYSHLFNINDQVSINRDKTRPDFLHLEIDKSNIDSDYLTIESKIIECKFVQSYEPYIIKAKKQVDAGLKRLSNIWDYNNNSVQRRYWLNQLYRIMVFNDHKFTINDYDKIKITNMLSLINQAKFNIKYKKIIYTFSYEQDYEKGYISNVYEGDEDTNIIHFDIGKSLIKKLLLKDESAEQAIREISKYIDSCDSTSSSDLNCKSSINNVIYDELERDVSCFDELDLGVVTLINSDNDVIVTKDINDNFMYKDDLNNYSNIYVNENTENISDTTSKGIEPEPIQKLDKFIKSDVKSQLIIDEYITLFEEEDEVEEQMLIVETEIARKNSTRMEDEFNFRKIKVHVKKFVIGPDIVRYSLKLGIGVNLSQIEKHKKDIKLWLGSSAEPFIFTKEMFVIIDVPRNNRRTVCISNIFTDMNELFSDKKLKKVNEHLYALLGVDVLGVPYIIDLSDSNSPHLLVAGQTGSGKSVLLTSILVSMMAIYSPENLEFILVDPKKVELTAFRDSPFTKFTATETNDAIAYLEWLEKEMDKRYTLFEKSGAKKLSDYNKRADIKLKRIVMVFDEYASMMEEDKEISKAIERAIKQLSAKARAAGIHLIICTQTPRADIITTPIRNNLTSRVGLRVADNTASQLILDKSGAENLLGKGDMFFKGADTSELLRLKSPFVSDDDLVDFLDYISGKYKKNMVCNNE